MPAPDKDLTAQGIEDTHSSGPGLLTSQEVSACQAVTLGKHASWSLGGMRVVLCPLFFARVSLLLGGDQAQAGLTWGSAAAGEVGARRACVSLPAAAASLPYSNSGLAHPPGQPC